MHKTWGEGQLNAGSAEHNHPGQASHMKNNTVQPHTDRAEHKTWGGGQFSSMKAVPSTTSQAKPSTCNTKRNKTER